jgi:hypothetical protein
LLAWIDGQADPRQQPDSLPGVLHHLTDAWRRRGPDPVRLVHYNDLCTDLAGQMHALAAWLDLDVGEPAWPALVAAAEFSSMRARADQLVPPAEAFSTTTPCSFAAAGPAQQPSCSAKPNFAATRPGSNDTPRPT